MPCFINPGGGELSFSFKKFPSVVGVSVCSRGRDRQRHIHNIIFFLRSISHVSPYRTVVDAIGTEATAAPRPITALSTLNITRYTEFMRCVSFNGNFRGYNQTLLLSVAG